MNRYPDLCRWTTQTTVLPSDVLASFPMGASMRQDPTRPVHGKHKDVNEMHLGHARYLLTQALDALQRIRGDHIDEPLIKEIGATVQSVVDLLEELQP
jgi:hypothetical protein